MKISRDQALHMISLFKMTMIGEIKVEETIKAWEDYGYVGNIEFKTGINIKDKINNLNLLDIIISETENIVRYGENISSQDLLEIFLNAKKNLENKIISK